MDGRQRLEQPSRRLFRPLEMRQRVSVVVRHQHKEVYRWHVLGLPNKPAQIHCGFCKLDGTYGWLPDGMLKGMTARQKELAEDLVKLELARLQRMTPEEVQEATAKSGLKNGNPRHR